MRLIALFVLLVVPLAASAQEPPKPPSATPEQQLDKIEAITKQIAELEKQKAELIAAFKSSLKAVQDRAAKLGIDGPTPPPPQPPEPKPDTKLRDKLAAAMAKDAGLKADVLQLAAIYREAAKVAADKDTPDSATLLARVRKVAEALIGADALPAVRAAAAEEILATLGMTSDEALTDAQRKRAAELFLRLASTLEELAK